ncbi:SGNH/GDSL hydrolase family protein [Candidatus Omnitrophota bacterium]
MFSDERDQEYIFGHKPNINVCLEKNGHIYTITTNSDGLRETKDYDFIDKSVIFLGDSIIEGASMENNEVIDEIFEDKTGIVSLNFGVGCYNTAHEYYWLKNKYKKQYNTKLVVLGFCLNDFLANTDFRYFDEGKGTWSFHKYLTLDSNNQTEKIYMRVKSILRKSKFVFCTYRFLRRNVFEPRSNSSISYSYRRGHEPKHSLYTGLYIRRIKELSEKIGANLVVIIFPRHEQIIERDQKPQMKIQDLLTKILRENNISYIDLYEVMKQAAIKNPDMQWYYDNTHPSRDGHKLIGEYLADELPKLFPEVFLVTIK